MNFILKSALLLPLSLGFLKGATIVSYPPDGFGITFSLFRLATPFLLTSASDINHVSFWIADNPPPSPALFSGDVSWAFYTNTVGSNVPGTILNEGTTKPSIAFTGRCPMFCEYRLDFTLPVGIQLGSGTYWLELHDGTTLEFDGGRGIWRGSSADPDSAGGLTHVESTDLNGVPRSPSGGLLALELSEVPEPATVSLMLLGLTAICSWGIHNTNDCSLRAHPFESGEPGVGGCGQLTP